jgi:hypothetical protein
VANSKDATVKKENTPYSLLSKSTINIHALDKSADTAGGIADNGPMGKKVSLSKGGAGDDSADQNLFGGKNPQGKG